MSLQRPARIARKRLDAIALELHLRARAANTRDLEIRIQGAREQSSEISTESLDALGRRLAAGEIAAIQIRFREAEAWWIETLVRANDGFRLVRMREGD